MSESGTVKEASTYTLGRKSERNFIGRIPQRTAAVIGVGVAMFIVAMFTGNMKFAMIVVASTAIVGVLVHYQPGGRSLPALPDEECVSDVKQAEWVTTTCRGWGRKCRRILQ